MQRHSESAVNQLLMWLLVATILVLGSGSLPTQARDYTRGTIVSVEGDRLRVETVDEITWILELIRPCMWCREDVPVILRPQGMLRATIEEEAPESISAVHRTQTLVIHRGP